MAAARRKGGTEHLYKRPNSSVWWCWFYDHEGARRRLSTGCTDKTAARAVLAQWERKAADPRSQADQSLNDCLLAYLDEQKASTSEVNVAFLEGKVKALVTVLGHDLMISTIEDSSTSWRYIQARRAMTWQKKPISDRTIKRELKTLRSALAIAKSQGHWFGDLDWIIPYGFRPEEAPEGDSIRRDEALRLFPHLAPDTAAATAFSLATGAEMAGLRNALRTDIPDDLSTCRLVLVRGTKNKHRFSEVPIVTDEQRILLAYAKRHARGTDGKLFGNLHRMLKELKAACVTEKIVAVSPHDLRRSAGRWMVELGVPIELVSRFMRHADTKTTEAFYARVKPQDVPDRILDAIDPSHASQAHQHRKKTPVKTLTVVPAPRPVEVLYEVDGVSKTLTEWSRAAGIKKNTLHDRVVTGGMSMADALRKGRPSYTPRKVAANG
jgi:integrase